jgi:holo-[acyl-carrier protein] synthase
MVIGIGTDIIEIDRVDYAMKSNAFINKVFTKEEMKLIQKKGRMTSAGNFAGKEAVAKALGTGFRGFSPKDIEILRTEVGLPYVVLYGKALEISKQLGVKNIQISISHCETYAIAYVITQ